MIVMKSQQVETAFMQFICLMKYMYTNPTKEAIPVEEEIDYIRQYIEIQKYRTETRTAYSCLTITTTSGKDCR